MLRDADIISIYRTLPLAVALLLLAGCSAGVRYVCGERWLHRSPAGEAGDLVNGAAYLACLATEPTSSAGPSSVPTAPTASEPR